LAKVYIVIVEVLFRSSYAVPALCACDCHSKLHLLAFVQSNPTILTNLSTWEEQEDYDEEKLGPGEKTYGRCIYNYNTGVLCSKLDSFQNYVEDNIHIRSKTD
jgi:hypothetical protein